MDDILFVVHTESELISEEGKGVEVTRLNSARRATNFERGFPMVNMSELTQEAMEELAFTEEERAVRFRRANPPGRQAAN